MNLKEIISYGTILTLAGSIVYGAESRYAHQNDMIVVQIQSMEYCLKILEDLQKKINDLEAKNPSSPRLAELRKKYDYFKKVCGMR